MIFPGDPQELAMKLVAEWAQSPAVELDPFEKAVEYFRSGAEYHERLAQHEAARLYAYCADFLETLISVVGDVELDYDRAEEVSNLARGTIRNKKQELGGARGKVLLGSLPLSGLAAGQNPGLRAKRGVDLINERRLAADEKAGEGRENEEWATRALHAIAS